MESEVVQLPIADQLWLWFEKNKKPVIWGTSAVVIVGLLVWFVIYQRDQKQVEASEALSNVAVEQANPAGARAVDAVGAYLKVASTYPGSTAAARAVLMAGGDLFAQGKYEDAMAQFQRFTREYHETAFMGEAQIGIAACLEAQGKTADATTAYKELIDRRPNDAVIPQAKFALGRLSAAQNQPSQALNYFEQVVQSDPYGSIGSEAGMRAEEIKLQHPELAPAATAPSASAPGAAAPFKLEKMTAPTPTNSAQTTAPAKK